MLEISKTMRGLWNLGNTCFFNTAVQCLAHVPPLTKHFFSVNLDQNPCDITREYQKVVRQLFIKDRQDPVSPSDLFGAFRVRFPSFADGHQHDAQEVILHLIDVFENSLGKELVQGLFNGTEAQETLWDGGMSTIRTPFTTLILDVSEPCRLEDLLTDRLEPIPVEDYTDHSGTTHRTAMIRKRIAEWPKFVSFSFSMYDYKFPIEIPLEFEGRKLFACILHKGHKNGGHYALLVRRFDKWYLKDDERVTEIPSISNMRGEFYLAFYRPMSS
jgi:ubiquitin C-terminal hydrolase